MVLATGLRQLDSGAGIGMDFSAVNEIKSRYGDLWDADLDYTEMPLMLGFALDQAMWAHAITENSQRKNITAIEEAQSIQRAIDEFGLKTEEAGKPFGYARSTTANKLRLLQLPADVRSAIADGRLTERHGRELVRLVDDPARLAEAAKGAIDKGSTVRQLAGEVDWREKDLKAAQAKAIEFTAIRQLLVDGLTLPGQSEAIPLGHLRTDIAYWQLHAFGGDNEKLLTQGICGPHCSCFALAYCDYRAEEGFRPDTERAPHICAGCTDYRQIKEKEDGLGRAADPEQQAEQDRKTERDRQAQKLNNEAHTIWQRWVAEQDLQRLWNDIRFWKEAVKHVYRLDDTFNPCDNVHDACQAVLRLLYKRTRHWDQALQNEVHQPAEIRVLIKALGGVSRETDSDK
jgi:ParB-like chromosome segregation protein Spo0J